MAGQCQKLKWNMKRIIGEIDDRKFAKLVGTDQLTIRKLRHDEDHWDKIPDTLRERIYATYEPMASYQPTQDKAHEVIGNLNEVEETLPKVEEKIEQLESSVLEVKQDGLNEQNEKTMTLVEFIFEELKESKTHSDFKANIGLLNRALSKY